MVWNKGISAPTIGSDFKRDKCGDLMKFEDHGNRNSSFGWEIDHINPVANGGADNLDNLQPLNWNNNASKSDSLNWRCSNHLRL